MSDLIYDELIKRLALLDEDADLSFDTDERCHLVIVGGGALILQRIIIRSTHFHKIMSGGFAHAGINI